MTEQIDTNPHTDLPEPPPGTHRTVSTYDRRTLWIAAAVLFGSIVIGVAAVAIFSDPGTPTPKTRAEQASERPRSIEQPNSGQKPEKPGDRGGWEQMLVFTVVCLSIVAIFAGATRGGTRKAKAGRAAWKAAGESGHDGAVP